MTGITLPRRLITPRDVAGTCGTAVMSIILMISRTLSTGRPYSSSASAKVRYLPASAPRSRSRSVLSQRSFVSSSVVPVSARPTYAAPSRRAPSASNPHAHRESGRCGRRRESRRRRRRARSANASPSDLMTTSCLPSSCVDDQRRRGASVVFDHDHGRLARVRHGFGDAEELAERAPAAAASRGPAPCAARPAPCAPAPASAGATRERAEVGRTKRSRADADDQAVETASVSGRRDGEGGALAGLGLDLDPAAQRFDVAADDVHADAAAGDLGDLLGGREAGLEDQLVDLVRRRRARPAAISPRSMALRAGCCPCSSPRRRRRSR